MGQVQSDPRSELETPRIWSDDAVKDTWPVNTIRPLIAAIRSHLLERMHLRGGGWSH
jgi:hypothetical protein